MKAKKWHRVIGLIMLLPLLLWSLTAIVFLIKPGYQSAYEKLALRYYPIDHSLAVSPKPDWQEIKFLKTILGIHLLVKEKGEWKQLDASSLQERAAPAQAEIEQLLGDAIASHRARYGHIVDVQDRTATTDTGVQISLDWPTLTLTQRGEDTRLIGALYKIHSLRWFGSRGPDLMLGSVGIVLLLVLSGIGLYAYFTGHDANET